MEEAVGRLDGRLSPITIRELLGDGVEGSWYATKHVNTARRVLLLLDDRSLAVLPSAKSIGSPH
jgi:hypothetical protein